MKQRNNILRFFILTIIGIFILSKSTYSQVTLWPKAGINLSWTTFSLNGNLPLTDKGSTYLETPTRFGFYGGFALDIRLTRFLLLRPEIIYNEFNVSRSLERNENFPSSGFYNSIRFRSESRRYFTFPISIVGQIKLGAGFLHIHSGAYVSIGLDGGAFTETIIESSPFYNERVFNTDGRLIADEVPLPWATNLSYYNPLDFGLNFGIGYQISRFLVSTQFVLGLTNTQPHYEADYSESLRGRHITKNRNIAIGLSYKIFK